MQDCCAPPRPGQRGDWRRFGSHFLQLPGSELIVAKRRRRPAGAGSGAGGRPGRQETPGLVPAPAVARAEPAAARAERLRSHPFPAILYPGWRLPKD